MAGSDETEESFVACSEHQLVAERMLAVESIACEPFGGYKHQSVRLVPLLRTSSSRTPFSFCRSALRKGKNHQIKLTFETETEK